MRRLPAQHAGQGFQMRDAFGQDQWATPLPHRRHHFVDNHAVARLRSRHRIAQALELPALVLLRLARRQKPGGSDQHLVSEGPPRRLCAGVDPVPHRAALHENNGMMAVLARHRGGQAGDEAGLGAARHQLETARGEMMALVHHQMAVSGHQIVDLALAHQALQQGNVDAGR